MDYFRRRGALPANTIVPSCELLFPQPAPAFSTKSKFPPGPPGEPPRGFKNRFQGVFNQKDVQIFLNKCKPDSNSTKKPLSEKERTMQKVVVPPFKPPKVVQRDIREWMYPPAPPTPTFMYTELFSDEDPSDSEDPPISDTDTDLSASDTECECESHDPYKFPPPTPPKWDCWKPPGPDTEKEGAN